MVCRWPQSHEGDWARPHLCKLARHGPWPVRKRFIRNHEWWGRWKPGCRIVWSVTIVWLTTEADNQSSFYCVIVSTDVMSDHNGHRDASRGGGCSKTSTHTGQCGWASMILSVLSVADLRHTEGGANPTCFDTRLTRVQEKYPAVKSSLHITEESCSGTCGRPQNCCGHQLVIQKI